METFSALLALCAGNSPVTGEFPLQRPVMQNFCVFFELRQNKKLSKQSRRWWFETPTCSLWRHCKEIRLWNHERYAIPRPYGRAIGMSFSCEVIISAMASPITGFSIVCSTVCSGTDQRKHQSFASLVFVKGIHRWPGGFPSQRASDAENVSIWWRHVNSKSDLSFTLVIFICCMQYRIILDRDNVTFYLLWSVLLKWIWKLIVISFPEEIQIEVYKCSLMSLGVNFVWKYIYYCWGKRNKRVQKCRLVMNDRFCWHYLSYSLFYW